VTQIHQPHDGLFRAALSDIRVVQEFVTCYFPSHLRNAFNLDTLKLQPQSYIDGQLKRTQSDVLYQAEIQEEQGYLYLLLEHWSTPKPLIPFYVHKYNIKIWDAYLKQNPNSKKLPLIINMVFYNGKTPYTSSTDFKDLLNAPKELVEQVWGKPLTLIDVSTIPDETIRSYQWVGILTFFMKHIWARDFLPYLIQGMQTLRALEEMGATDYVQSLLHYVLSEAETDNPNDFVTIIKEGLSEPTRKEIMTIAEQYRHEGEYNLLLSLIQHKFRQVPESCRQKMASANTDTLLKWAKRVLDAKNLEDIFVG
jgi:predicted transposase/invertase (TIGR01784 family)